LVNCGLFAAAKPRLEILPETLPIILSVAILTARTRGLMPMDQRAAQSLNADLNALQKELKELCEWANMAAMQKRDQPAADQSDMVIRGK
jgi:hypothetical protein